MDRASVSKGYLEVREQVLKYTYTDMNLKLENDEQVYIAVFDIPTKSGLLYGQTQTLALVFGLNANIYFGNGDVLTGLEKNKNVMQAMQSLFISSPQVLTAMELVESFNYYDSKNIRAYLKTRRGVYFKELSEESNENNFLKMLIGNVINEVSKVV